MKRCRGPSRLFPEGICDVSYDGGLQEVCLEEARPDKVASQGPTSLPQCFDWAQHFLHELESDKESFARLLENIRGGLNIRTHYSGMDAPVEALRTLLEVIAASGLPVTPEESMHLSHAADMWQPAQKVLCSLPHGPSHVFGDILERWGPQVVGELEAIEAEVETNYEVAKEKIMTLVQDPTKAQKQLRTLRADMSEQTIDRMMACLEAHKGVLQDCTSQCCKHQRKCRTMDVTQEPGKLTCAVAGASCVEFSTMGGQRHFSGKTAKVFLSWLAERKTVADSEAFFLVENVPQFSAYIDKFATLLPDHSIQTVQLSPHLFGFPNTRNRIFVLFLNTKQGYRLRKPFCETSFQRFQRSVVLDGDALFMAPVEEVKLHQAARSRAQSDRSTVAANAAEASMGVGSRMRLEGHVQAEAERMMAAKRKHDDHEVSGDKPRIVNLTQTSQFSTPSQLMPALLTRCEMFSFRHRRSLIPYEHLVTMGMPMYPELQGTGAGSLAQVLHNLRQADELTDIALLKLAGNAMHQTPIGVVLGFILSELVLTRCKEESIEGT